MDPNLAAVERALQLAKSGLYRTPVEVKTCLQQEGYFADAVGSSVLLMHLNLLIREARRTPGRKS
jgi:hypothetical protein